MCTELLGRFVRIFFEHFAEMVLIAVTAQQRNFLNAAGCAAQQKLGLLHPDFRAVGNGRTANIFRKKRNKIIFA